MTAAGAVIFVLALQLIRLAGFQEQRWEARATSNLLAKRRLNAPRGNILDAQGRLLATNERTWTVTFGARGIPLQEATEGLDRLWASVPALSPKPATELFQNKERVTLARRLRQTDVLPILERPDDFPGVRIEEDFRRTYQYPYELSLVLGHVGKIQPTQTERFARPRYLPDDEVGAAGLERLLEDRLAGHPGVEQLHRDARGRQLANPEVIEAARAGADVQLTLDAEWQIAAYAALGKETGSIILMELDGAVRVLASTPAYDPMNPGAQQWQGSPTGFFPRATSGQYPPGSTFKVVGASAALRSGMSATDEIHCDGSHTVQGWSRPFWCNVRTGHGGTNLSRSLKVSCNAYYYTLADRLGAGPLRAEAERFGFGRETGIELTEKNGFLPPAEEMGHGERTNFSIGQGKLLATPLQVARVYAGLANGGEMPRPRVVHRIGSETTPATQSTESMGITPDHLASIADGLRRAVNESGGTVFKVGIPAEWRVAGKTGTAENAQGGVDAWFAGYFPYDAPRYAFVVHVEGAAGHGGDIAGPIAQELLSHILSPQDSKLLSQSIGLD
jgi:penicillin-binding protein 2